MPQSCACLWLWFLGRKSHVTDTWYLSTSVLCTYLLSSYLFLRITGTYQSELADTKILNCHIVNEYSCPLFSLCTYCVVTITERACIFHVFESCKWMRFCIFNYVYKDRESRIQIFSSFFLQTPSLSVVVILLLKFFHCGKKKPSKLMLAKGSAAEQNSANWFLTEFLVLLLV